MYLPIPVEQLPPSPVPTPTNKDKKRGKRKKKAEVTPSKAEAEQADPELVNFPWLNLTSLILTLTLPAAEGFTRGRLAANVQRRGCRCPILA